MRNFVRLYTNINGEINRFLKSFYLATEEILKNINNDTLELQIEFDNPVEMSDLIGTFIENKDEFKRYLYERFPY